MIGHAAIIVALPQIPATRQRGRCLKFQIAKERNGKFPRKLRSGQHEFSRNLRRADLARKMLPGQDPNPGLRPGLHPGLPSAIAPRVTPGVTPGITGRFDGVTPRMTGFKVERAPENPFRAKGNASRERERLGAEKIFSSQPQNCSFPMNSFCGRARASRHSRADGNPVTGAP